MIDLNEFLHIQGFFEDGVDYFICPDRGFPTCGDGKAKHNESGEIEIVNWGIKLDLKSFTIEDKFDINPIEKYTIDQVNSGYEEAKDHGSYTTRGALTLKTDDPTNKLRSVTFMKLPHMN